jgi:hypothetical protein
MADIGTLIDFTGGNVLYANQLDSNFGAIRTVVNNAVVHTDKASQVITKSLTITPDSGVALTATSGGVTLTAGDLTVTADDVVVTAGDVTVTAGNVTAGGAITATGAVTGGSLVTTGTTTLNGVALTWPASNVAGVLANNGSGALSYSPIASVQVSGGGTSTTTSAAMSFSTEVIDAAGFFTSGAPTRITVPSGYDGTYLFSGMFRCTTNATTYTINVRKNGSVVVGGNMQYEATTSTLVERNFPTCMIPLAAGDYIDILIASSGTASTSLGVANLVRLSA